jgi:hypothetical protein
MNREARSTGVAIAISAVAIVLFCAKVFAQAKFPNLKLDDATTIALVVFAAAPWLARLFELIKFGDFEFKFQKLEQNQQQHQLELQEHAKYLAQLFNGLVGERGREFLSYLRDKKPFVYTYSDDTKQDYRTMLRQLRLLGFIEASDSVSHIIDDKRPKVDLTQEIALTPLGESYLASPVSRMPIVTNATTRNA